MNQQIKNKLDGFFAHFQPIKYKKRQIINEPGAKTEKVTFVKSGYVRLYTMSKDGEEFTLNTFDSVFYLSLINVLSSTKNNYFMEAITPVELYEAPKEELIEFFNKEPGLMFELLVDVLDNFRNNLVNSQYLVQGTAYSKVASVLMSLANDYGTKKEKKVTLNFATTHRVLASLTGIARETTSLQILKLKDKGIIQTKGSHFVINDIEKLKKETVF